jgi:hypothetical protein
MKSAKNRFYFFIALTIFLQRAIQIREVLNKERASRELAFHGFP